MTHLHKSRSTTHTIDKMSLYLIIGLVATNCIKKMGDFGGQNAHSTLNTDCESGV